MPFRNWEARLAVVQQHKTVAARRAAIAALKINFAQPSADDEGYYRKAITKKALGADGKTNGQNVVTGWTAVAYFLHEGQLMGTVGTQGRSRNMKPNELTDEELWSYVVSNPIPWQWYDAVVNKGEPWPDSPDATLDRVMGASADDQANLEAAGKRAQENAPEPQGEPEAPAVPLNEEFAKKIDAAISAAASLAVTSHTEVAIAEGSRNFIAEIRLKAAKAGEARVKPLHDAYVAEREKWLPMVNRAAMAEKGIKDKVLRFENDERKRILIEQAEAAAKQREIDEANERAAQRAIAQGQPENPPPVAAVEQPEPMPPAPVAPTYGTRRTRATLKKFAVIKDAAKVYEFFKNNADMMALLEKLATDAIRAGVEVPGTETDERLA